METFGYTQNLNRGNNERNFNLIRQPQIINETIQTQKDYQHSIAIITALQELIDIEEAKIADYFRRKKA